MLAGAKNCAAVAPEIVLFHSADILEDSTGPRSGGTLKDANIVKQSRTANRAYDGNGTGRTGAPAGPNMRTKAWSLKIHNPMLAVLDAANFAVPDVTSVEGLF